MVITASGDYLSSLALRSQNAALKAEFNNVTQEVASGTIHDMGEALSGNFRPIAAIEHELSQLESYSTSIQEAELFFKVAQTSLESIDLQASELSRSLLSASASTNAAGIEASAVLAEQVFGNIVASLNTRSAGRGVFSGAATDQPAIAQSNVILDELQQLVQSATSASEVSVALDAWFVDGGQFDTVAYLGSPGAKVSFPVGAGETLYMATTAADAPLRETLKATAKAALISRGILDDQPSEQRSILQTSAIQLKSSQSALLISRATIGESER